MAFIKKYWPVMLFSVLALIAGALITKWRIQTENKKLLDVITAQIEALHVKAVTSKLSAAEREQLKIEEAQAALLKQKT